MPKIRFICIANSRKDGQRCIAGIDSDGNWIRLVNKGGHALTLRDIKDEHGNQPEVLETWEAEVISEEPLYFQPENWVINDKYYWELSDEDIYPDFDEFCDNHKYIFLDSSDRLSSDYLRQNPISQSLMLIYVEEIIFEKTNNIGNRLQIRAKFWYKRNFYNLVFTDTNWESQFKDPNGPYWDFSEYSFEDGYYLTIGLGTEFQGNHFKLVVAVIPTELVDEVQSNYEIDEDIDF